MVETVIQPQSGWAPLRLRELWAYRELFFFLTWRDVLVRYKQAVLGIAWAVLQPVITMVVFTVIFGRLAGLSSEGVPYPLFSLAALVPWQLFAGSIQRGGSSLVGNANLLTKVYFPRLIMPTAAVGAALVDYGISLVVLACVMLYYGFAPAWSAILIAPLTLLAALTALSVTLWLSALNVLYRDVQQLIPFLLQLWMYMSPVVYSADLIPEGPWQLVYALNPMTGVIQAFRWALLGGEPPGVYLLVSMLTTTVLLTGGLFYFKRMERTFADVV